MHAVSDRRVSLVTILVGHLIHWSCMLSAICNVACCGQRDKAYYLSHYYRRSSQRTATLIGAHAQYTIKMRVARHIFDVMSNLNDISDYCMRVVVVAERYNDVTTGARSFIYYDRRQVLVCDIENLRRVCVILTRRRI